MSNFEKSIPASNSMLALRREGRREDDGCCWTEEEGRGSETEGLGVGSLLDERALLPLSEEEPDGSFDLEREREEEELSDWDLDLEELSDLVPDLLEEDFFLSLPSLSAVLLPAMLLSFVS